MGGRGRVLPWALAVALPVPKLAAVRGVVGVGHHLEQMCALNEQAYTYACKATDRRLLVRTLDPRHGTVAGEERKRRNGAVRNLDGKV